MPKPHTETQREWLDRNLAAAPALTAAKRRRICQLLAPAPTGPTMPLRVTHNKAVA